MKKEHFEILLEDIKGKFNLIIEGHQVLDKKIEHTKVYLDKKIENNKYELIELKKFLGEYLDKVNLMLENHDKRIGKLEEKIAS